MERDRGRVINRKTSAVMAALAFGGGVSACSESSEPAICSAEISLEQTNSELSVGEVQDTYTLEYDSYNERLNVEFNKGNGWVAVEALPQTMTVGGQRLRLVGDDEANEAIREALEKEQSDIDFPDSAEVNISCTD